MKQTEATKKKNVCKKAGIILFWLFVWQLAQLAVANEVLLAGPMQVIKYLASQIGKKEFWQVILSSVMRIGLGFFLAFFTGIVLGAVSHRYSFVKELLEPVISVFKSIPVASFVVLILIWFGSKQLSFFCSFLVAFPNVYESILTGLAHVDREMKELMDVYQVHCSKKIMYLYVPAIFPYLTNSLRTCLGMSMKSGVAAEVIGTPEFSIGERIYMSKVYLDTSGILGWTIVLITVSFLLEKGILWVFFKFGELKPFLKGGKVAYDKNKKKQPEAKPWLFIDKVSKSYGKHQILKDFELTCQLATTYCIKGPSGIGKTTLLKILAGLEPVDAGKIYFVNSQKKPEYHESEQGKKDKKYKLKAAMVFQNSRLNERLSAVDNVMLTAESGGSLTRNMAEKELVRLLPKDCINMPVSQLSGGMRRRVEIVRAMNAECQLVLLDEPFMGLDKENKEKAAAYIQEKRAEKTIFVSVHSEEECRMLHGILVEI